MEHLKGKQMKSYPPLYKRRHDGKVHVWTLQRKGNRLRTVSGIKDGAMVTSAWTECESKGKGKSLTSPREQAIKEAKAMYKDKQVTGGYHPTVDAVDNEGYFKPMLAQDFKKNKKAVLREFKTGLVQLQPKLDGVRCIATAQGLFSRKGKALLSAPHVHEDLVKRFGSKEGWRLDGELYTDKLADNFNEIISLARKTKPSEAALRKSKETLQYHIYDCPASEKFSVRYALLQMAFAEEHPGESLRLVPTVIVKSIKEIKDHASRFVAEGYEGAIIRLDKPYEIGKRSKSLLKYKNFMDKEYTLVKVLEGKGNRAGMAGKLRLRLAKGKTFKSGIKGGVAFYKQLWKDREKLKGLPVTIRFQNFTPKGVPRFPVAIAIRDYE